MSRRKSEVRNQNAERFRRFDKPSHEILAGASLLQGKSEGILRNM